MATFEERLQRLEQLGDELRQGNLPIDQAMGRFEEGIKLARTLERDLAKIERRIEILVNEPDKNDAAPSLELFPGLEAEDSSPSQQP
jgi:exodeoxyribonuclease VII small subunit